MKTHTYAGDDPEAAYAYGYGYMKVTTLERHMHTGAHAHMQVTTLELATLREGNFFGEGAHVHLPMHPCACTYYAHPLHTLCTPKSGHFR